MKADRVKKILLGILIVIAGYIWWGNMQFFSSQAPSEQKNRAAQLGGISGSDNSEITYHEPLIDPFWPEAKAETNRAAVQKKVPRPRPPAVSLDWRLMGILDNRQLPSAVVTQAGGASKVVTKGDSIGLWLVMAVNRDGIVVRQEHWYDTLRLPALPRL